MIISLLALAAVAAADSDPLARARAGEMQCLSPDVLFKTCVSLERYSPTGPGTYNDRGQNLVDYNRPMIMETVVPVQVRGKAVCGTVRSAHVLGGSVSIGGQPLPRAKAAALLARFNNRLASIRGKEACSTYEPTDDGMYKIKVTLAGVRRSDLDSVFKWVRPSDGYTVAP